jgi:hypothetical protein
VLCAAFRVLVGVAAAGPGARGHGDCSSCCRAGPLEVAPLAGKQDVAPKLASWTHRPRHGRLACLVWFVPYQALEGLLQELR